MSIQQSIVSKILTLLNPDIKTIERGRKRQKAIWQGYEPDYLPILIGGIKNLYSYTDSGKHKVNYDWRLKFPHGPLFGGVEVSEFDLFSHYDLKEQFYDKEKMLTEYLWDLIARGRCKSDAQLSIRPNHGCVLLPSVFNVEYHVFPDKPPWLTQHLSIEQITNQSLSNIGERGIFPMVSEFMRYFKKELKDRAQPYLPNLAGPFDLAHLLRGTDIFLDMYDNSTSVFKIMEKTTEAFMKANIFFKKVINEPLTSGVYDAVYLANGGVRVTEDSSILLSPNMWNKFVKPFIREALKPFGGGVVHFCGKNEPLLDALLSIPEVKGINLGNPEMYDYESTIKKFITTGKVYCGTSWPRGKNESVNDYFSRILSPLKGKKRGLIFQPRGEGEWLEPEKTIDLWHSLQNG